MSCKATYDGIKIYGTGKTDDEALKNTKEDVKDVKIITISDIVKFYVEEVGVTPALVYDEGEENMYFHPMEIEEEET